MFFAGKFEVWESEVINLVRYYMQRRAENDAL